MSNPILRLREASEALSPTERSVAAQIISDPSLVLDNSIRSLAQKVFCSTATIVRLCNHIGYPGYRDFARPWPMSWPSGTRPSGTSSRPLSATTLWSRS